MLLQLMFFHDVQMWKVEDRIAKDKQNLRIENLVSLMNQVVKAHTEVAAKATGTQF